MDKMNKILYCVILFFIPWLGKFLNGRTVPGIVELILWIFFIGWIGTIIATLIYDNVETGNSLFVLIIGIIVICLSKMFEYGKELQDAEDGLI